jgi:hypothetical protein
MLGGLADAAGISASAFASLGAPSRFERIISDAGRWAGELYGSQARDLRGVIASRHDLLAEAFENGIANQGFTIVGAVLPGYVEEMIRYWERESPRESPVSPHILAARARPRRIHLREASVDARNQRLDEGLAGRIAGAFSQELCGACRTALTTV